MPVGQVLHQELMQQKESQVWRVLKWFATATYTALLGSPASEHEYSQLVVVSLLDKLVATVSLAKECMSLAELQV